MDSGEGSGGKGGMEGGRDDGGIKALGESGGPGIRCKWENKVNISTPLRHKGKETG